jgi:thymidine kinase
MSIKLFLGSMWSAKSSRLIQEYQKWNCIGKPTLVINHRIDDRYGDDEYLYTHDQVRIPCVLANRLSEIDQKLIDGCEAIFINEGQFFGDLKEKCLEWCEKMDKHIYIVGLDGDRYRQKFGQVLDLIPYADHYEKLLAKCKQCLDGTPACFTYDQGSSAVREEQIRVGSEQYLPLCRKHYLRAIKGGDATREI